MHFGWAEAYSYSKCEYRDCAIFVSGGLRSRYPLIKSISGNTNGTLSFPEFWLGQHLFLAELSLILGRGHHNFLVRFSSFLGKVVILN